MLFCLFAVTALGQITSPVDGRSYTLKCKATDHVGYIADDGTNVQGRANSATAFIFEAVEGVENGFYIKSEVSGKYLYATGGNGEGVVLSSENKTIWAVNAPDHSAGYVSLAAHGETDLYLNNNGGTNNLRLNSHSGGPGSGNACSLWQLSEKIKLPELSTEGNIKWYTIKNVRKQKFATYAGDDATMTQQATASAASFFYFTASTTEGAVKIHNYAAGDKLCAAYNSWTETGIDWYLKAQSTGVSICTSTDEWNAWNDAGGGGQLVEYWSASDAGSAWEFTLVTNFSSIIDVPAAKAAAIAEIESYATVSTIYPNATTTVDAINAVTAADNSLAGLNTAIEAINAKVIDYKKAAYAALEGKYFSIQTRTTERSKGFMEMASSKVVGAETLASPAGVWQFVSNNDGTLKVFNPYTGKYLCEPQGNSEEVAVTTDANSAGSYTLAVNNTNPAVADAKIKFTSNGKSVHMAGGHTLVRWDNGGASEWAVIEVTDFSALIEAYKTSTISTLDSWATLSVVFDASLIATAKTQINNINTNSFETFAALDAELTNVTDAVAAKMFTFQTLATDAHRENVWVSANASTGKAIGAHTAEADYNAIWSLRHAGGVSFYIYNELTGKYMGKPSGNATLTETPVDAYTFEIIDAANGVVEFKCGGETLHASNHDDDKLLSWDGDENASRWYIRTIDIAADIQAILDGLTSENYAETPALGQYPKTAYDALVAARTNAKTVEEVNAAIVAFNNSKNRPVFMITGVKDYVLGKSIYDDNDAAPNFKTTNVYDKTMWWALDMTETTVGVTEEVGIQNVGTGNGFWGVSSIKITETNENDGAGIADDDIFLFYTTGNNTPIHFQNTDQVIVRYGSYEANSGSAMKFIYIGNSYDLDKLTEEKIAALTELQTAYNANKDFINAEIGEGLGQYTCDEEYIYGFDFALGKAQEIVEGSLAEQATKDISTIQGYTAVISQASTKYQINLPAAGKYYRFQGACDVTPAEYAHYYITGHTNDDGGRIALTKDADASTIYYFDGTNLIAYQSGLVIGLNSGHWVFASVDDDSKPASTITFAGSPRKAGTYTIKSADRYFHYFYYNENNTVQVNRCQDDVCAEHDWYITEVTELPVRITAAGYASFYAPVEVTLPAEVTAHTVTKNGEYATLSDAISVVPAENGVILAGEEGTYNLTISNKGAEDLTNALSGTIAKTLFTKTEGDAYYVLGMIEGAVGLYNPVKGEDDTKFYNAGHKAYWHIPAVSQTVGYRFGGNTTAIESVIISADANAPIYDLSGRRVNNAVKGGIYIVNGKKVYVK